MQKRAQIGIDYVPSTFDPEFPFKCQPHFEQGDRPITSLHVHNYLELGVCHQGCGIFMVGDRIFSFQEGDVSFISPGEVHLAQSTPGSHSLWSWINLDLAGMGESPLEEKWFDTRRLAGPGFPSILSRSANQQANTVIQSILKEMLEDQPGRLFLLKALVRELMVRMHRMVSSSSPSVLRVEGKRAPENYDRLAPALQFIASRYDEPVDIPQLAGKCGLSAPHFRRLFRATVGQSPRSYWHSMRLRMAGSLLRNSSLSVLEISREVGFESLSSFNRLFRKIHGTSPLTWRRT